VSVIRTISHVTATATQLPNFRIENLALDNIDLEHVQHIKDLGVIFDAKLNFSLHISDKVNKANSILDIIKRNFSYLSQECFVMLYKALVRSHLEYANAVWSLYKKVIFMYLMEFKGGQLN